MNLGISLSQVSLRLAAKMEVVQGDAVQRRGLLAIGSAVMLFRYLEG